MAADAAACAAVGAAAVHLHPRDDAGRETLAPEAVADALGEPPVLLHAEGPAVWVVLAEAVRRGLDTRIGLEDTRTLPDGRSAAGKPHWSRRQRSWEPAEGRRLRRMTAAGEPQAYIDHRIR